MMSPARGMKPTPAATALSVRTRIAEHTACKATHLDAEVRLTESHALRHGSWKVGLAALPEHEEVVERDVDQVAKKRDSVREQKEVVSTLRAFADAGKPSSQSKEGSPAKAQSCE